MVISANAYQSFVHVTVLLHLYQMESHACTCSKTFSSILIADDYRMGCEIYLRSVFSVRISCCCKTKRSDIFVNSFGARPYYDNEAKDDKAFSWSVGAGVRFD